MPSSQPTAPRLHVPQSIAETDSGAPVTDAVLSVPTYYTEPERHAMLAAAQVRLGGASDAVAAGAWSCRVQ